MGDRRLYGIILVTVSTVLWSSAGLFVRAIQLDVWTMVAWRSLFAFASLLILAVVLRGPGAFRLRESVGLSGLIAIPVMAISMFSYVAALKLTTVANVMIVYATVPFFAAGFAYALMRERVDTRVTAACGVGFLGVLIMVGFATAPADLAGNAFALLMTMGFAASVVIAKRWPSHDVTLVTAFASGLCAAACFLFASSIVPEPKLLLLLLLFSLATQSASYLLFLLGGRHIPASEAGLIALLDVVLGPLWVWIAFAEQPTAPAFVGGALTLSAVVVYLTTSRPAHTLWKARTAKPSR